MKQLIYGILTAGMAVAVLSGCGKNGGVFLFSEKIFEGKIARKLDLSDIYGGFFLSI